ncbi:glycosyltransferase [Thermosynechococcus sp.]|uniref:glycosyltransferase family 2 protein n=1 Tax=Thermosynechococcus sp. TaxID=2814275 RepID=UPI0026353BFA|nr:glycosyltransferase [Thermosynechococcus sp.]
MTTGIMNNQPNLLDISSIASTRAKPRLSIGMPVYNGAKFIRDALDSLLGQSFTNFELIISDNASTDETEAICREYAAKDSRIRYVRQTHNRGAAANFKYVLDQAVAEYFMWAAADDVWDRDWVAALLPIAVKNSCLAFGSIRTIDEVGTLISHPANNGTFTYSGSKPLRRLKYVLEPNFLGKANPIYGIFPKKIIGDDAINILSSGLWAADTHFLYHILGKCDIKSTKEVFLYKRIHSLGASNPEHSDFDRAVANLRGYGAQSSIFERILLVSLLPVAPLARIYGMFIQVKRQIEEAMFLNSRV